MSYYKKKKNLAERKIESRRILIKYPNRVPVFLEFDLKKPNPQYYKYLIPENLTVGQLYYILKKNIGENESIYFSVNGELLSSTECLYSLYRRHKEDDGFLYIKYHKESVFG